MSSVNLIIKTTDNPRDQIKIIIRIEITTDALNYNVTAYDYKSSKSFNLDEFFAE